MFVAPSGKTNITGRAVAWLVGLSTTFRVPGRFLRALSTAFPRSVRTAGPGRPASRDVVGARRSAWQAGPRRGAWSGGPCRPPPGRRRGRQRETPEGTAESVASDPVQAPGRRFRSRGPFRQDLRYGRTDRVPRGFIHDFRSSRAVLEALVHRLPTYPVAPQRRRSARRIESTAGVRRQRRESWTWRGSTLATGAADPHRGSP